MLDTGPDWFEGIREAERKHSKYAHLRDKWIPDEYAAAETVWEMQSISPVFKDFFKDQRMRNAMGVFDQNQYDKLRRDFPSLGMTKLVGEMPEGMLVMLWAQDADILKDRERMYKFLNTRTEYRTGDKPLDPGWQPEIGV